jgi:hypothetical protein
MPISIQDHPDESTRTDPLANGILTTQKQEIVGGDGIVSYQAGGQQIVEDNGPTETKQ